MKLLIIEDDVNFVIILVRCFIKYGFVCEFVYNKE